MGGSNGNWHDPAALGALGTLAALGGAAVAKIISWARRDEAALVALKQYEERIARVEAALEVHQRRLEEHERTCTEIRVETQNLLTAARERDKGFAKTLTRIDHAVERLDQKLDEARRFFEQRAP